ncbi:MAG TPA: hypothetical protein VJ814_07285 [Gaiellaceae bacterium]|nr:hypothetical protein [Gaiellaceae bacterium]
MTERDADQAWIDGLAGRGGDPETRKLRERILAREVVEAPFVPEIDPRREEQLVARARRAGLVPKNSVLAWPGWQGLAGLAAAASVLLVLGFLMRPAPAPQVEAVRAVPGGVLRVEAADPHGLQHKIAEELQAVGVSAVLYDRLNTYGIDADLPSPLPPEVAEVLKRHHIPPPSDGVLKLELAEPGPK